MRTDLDHLPAFKQRELEHVLQVLFEEFSTAQENAKGRRTRGRIVKIILYGSHARGGWVDEPHTVKVYVSDFDLLVIVSHPALGKARGQACTQFDAPKLPRQQRGSHPDVIGVLGQIIASFLAVATAAMGLPRLEATRWKNARSGPGERATAHAASTSIPRAWPRPCLVILPW